MGYASIAEVELILPTALTSAKPTGTLNKVNIVNIGNSRDLNRIPNEMLEYYISIADQTIDGILSQMYQMPLKKCPNGQWDLDFPLSEYNQEIQLSDATNFVPGDEIIIRDDDTGIQEHHIVAIVVDQNTITTVSPIETNFEGEEVRVFRLTFPPPISEISARLAASYIYDKFFSAQGSPNVSEYGLEMRKKAENRLNDILNGRTTLRCQRRIGDMFGNSYLDSRMALYEGPQEFSANERDISKG